MKRPSAAFLRRLPRGVGIDRGHLQSSAAHPLACGPATSDPKQQQQHHEVCSRSSLVSNSLCVRPWSFTTTRCSASAASASAAAGSPTPPPPAAAAAAPAAAATGAAAGEDASYRFKSEAHRAMVIACTRLHLQDLLLQRFGRLRTAECRALRKGAGVRRLLLLWAEMLVEENPTNPQADAFFVPPKLYQLPEIQALLEKDGEVRWLMRRIDPKGKGGACDSTEDCVPAPSFPSVLQQQLPQFPFQPQQIEFLRDTYGLLKWPFKPTPAAAAAAAAAGETASLPRVAEAEPTPEGVAAAVAAVAAAVDKGDVQRANSQVLTACNTSAIYAPDEMETAAYTMQ